MVIACAKLVCYAGVLTAVLLIAAAGIGITLPATDAASLSLLFSVLRAVLQHRVSNPVHVRLIASEEVRPSDAMSRR